MLPPHYGCGALKQPLTASKSEQAYYGTTAPPQRTVLQFKHQSHLEEGMLLTTQLREKRTAHCWVLLLTRD